MLWRDSGETVQHRHHYQASRMALWLDLIPKLHRSDGHDDQFDQFHDEDGESPALADDVFAVDPPPYDYDDDVLPTGDTSILATHSARRLYLLSPAPTSARSPVNKGSELDHADSPAVKSTIVPRAALTVTLAIGFIALIVNCVIFVVVYRRRVSLKRFPPTNDAYPPSPSVNVVGSSTKSSAVDARNTDGVIPRGRHHQSVLYVAAESDDQSPGRHRATPPPPPPPPPSQSSRPSSYSPRCLADSCLLRRSTEHANHVGVGASMSLPRTTAPASDVWVQLTTTHWFRQSHWHPCTNHPRRLHRRRFLKSRRLIISS